MGTVFEVERLRQEKQAFDLIERDAEHARLSDYILFFAISAVSFSLIGFGLLKLIGSL